MDPMKIAASGLSAATARLEASARRTARMAQDPDVDTGSEVVEQITAKHQFSANLGVIKVADQMWKALLEIQEIKRK